jgi:hypothetical protein
LAQRLGCPITAAFVARLLVGFAAYVHAQFL